MRNSSYPFFTSVLGPLAAAGFCLAGGCQLTDVAPVKVRTITRSIRVGDIDVRVLDTGPKAAATVLLLHGGRFSSATWDELGTLRHLARHKLRAIAIDLPGFGETPRSQQKPAAFLSKLMDAMGLSRAVLVSPSMSGRFSLPLLIAHPERIAGLVAVAPVGIPRHIDRLATIEVPVLTVWGSEDRVVPLAHADLLASRMANVQRLVLQGAGHPSYLDQPERFHAALVQFARRVHRVN